MVRKSLSPSAQARVLIASRRRCCLCVFLDNFHEVRRGQIAHINRDPTDARYDNLVFLCLDHHDEYDSKRRQSKGYLAEEIIQYREKLYNQYQTNIRSRENIDETAIELDPLPDTPTYQVLRSRFKGELEFMSEPWRYSPLGQTANEPEYFAYKAPNRFDGVCLIERIDLPDGRIVIVCIQTPGNPGNSITNCVESICFQVCERFEIPAERLVWIEHYDIYDSTDWNLVRFEKQPPESPFENPSWTEMTPSMWKELMLRPKKTITSKHFSIESRIQKLFDWPPC